MMDNNDYTTSGATRDAGPLRQLEIERDHLASYDPITGLPQLPLFLLQAARAARECAKHGQPLSAMAIAFDSLEMAAGLYGFDGGDLLRGLAQHLRHAMRGEHFFVRAGRAFVVLLPAMDGPRAAMFAQRLVEHGVLFESGGAKAVVAACAGTATIDEFRGAPECEVRRLIDRSISALHASLREGWGGCSTYSPAMELRLRRTKAIERAVCSAVHRGDFYVLYQPIVEIATGRIAAVEALTRWEHPELGAVTPSEFIPFIERRGLAPEFDRWVLERSLSDISRLRAPELDIHVNINAAHFSSASVVATLLEVVDESAIPRERVVVEVTETSAPERFEQLIENVNEARAAGLRIAIDDLGTGFNSLRYFASLSVDVAKIDRSFLSGPGALDRQRIIVDALAATGDKLGITTVVEGVETAEDHAFAVSTGARFAQGYLYSMPLSVHHLEKKLLLPPTPV